MAARKRKRGVLVTEGKLDETSPTHVVRVDEAGIRTSTVYPLKDGRALPAHGQICDIEERSEGVYDVEVRHDLGSGPSQVATDDYRDGWDRTFGRVGKPN